MSVQDPTLAGTEPLNRYRRHFDPSRLARESFDYQVLADLESCLVVGCRAPAGSQGYPRHRHLVSDQVYYVLNGRMHLEAEGVEYSFGPGTAVVIPAGTAHRNWYPGEEDEIHLDFLVPPPERGRPLAEPAPEGTASVAPADRELVVRTVADSPSVQPVPGFTARPLLTPQFGSPELVLVDAAVASEDGDGVPWHIHPVDQLYFLLEGRLHVEVADTSFVSEPFDLIVLPAGVPHRNWNPGSEPEHHLAFLVPPVGVGEGLDKFVDFAVREESLRMP
mgnify:CR=1 FL=1